MCTSAYLYYNGFVHMQEELYIFFICIQKLVHACAPQRIFILKSLVVNILTLGRHSGF
jgi:hypothetical protein